MSITYQHVVLGDIRVLEAPADQSLSDSRRTNMGLRYDSEGIFLILLVESKLLLVILANLVTRGEKSVFQINSCIQSARSTVVSSSKETTSGPVPR